MKPDEIAELERLLEEALPGQWVAEDAAVGSGTCAWGVVTEATDEECGSIVVCQDVLGPEARLIAAMRNALPRLLAERRELRAKVLKAKSNALYRAASLKMATFDDDEGRRLMRYYRLFTRWAQAIREGRR